MSDARLLPADATSLRHLISETLADYKAYDVPSVCRRYGLADGDEREAFASKYKYVHRRVAELPADEVLKVARAVIAEETAFELRDAVAKIDERAGRRISDVTRRRLVAALRGVHLAGSMPLLEFLRRICPIDVMPSRTYRNAGGATVADSIDRHCGRNDDWDSGDILEELGIYERSQGFVFRVLEEVTHPITRPQEDQRRIATAITDVLRPDGFALIEVGRVSGSPIFKVREVGADSATPADASIGEVLSAFDEAAVYEIWERALDRRARDPEGAITLARTLVEDVCKRILDDTGEPYADDGDLPKLYRQAAKVLRLAPDDHTEDAFKRILGSCQSVVETLGTLRNRLGDAHGGGRGRVRPRARHAQLAVNLAGAMALFLVATWDARKRERAAGPR